MMLWIMINSILYNSPCDKEGEEPGVLISKSDFEDDNWRAPFYSQLMANFRFRKRLRTIYD